MTLTLADAADGDSVIIHKTNYKLMGKIGDAWLCREDGVGDIKMFVDWQPIESICFVNPTRASQRMEDNIDPLMQRGDGELLEWREDQPETD